VMAIRTPTGRTFPGYFTIILSAKKWVFHAVYCLAFLSLYGEHICSLNQLVLTDKEDAEYCSFENLFVTHEMFDLQLSCSEHFVQYGNHLRETFITYYHKKTKN
jgi:hypothetical protein